MILFLSSNQKRFIDIMVLIGNTHMRFISDKSNEKPNTTIMFTSIKLHIIM